ncbi:LuxR C-terminal-related transcriptional regulator [Nocardioides kongjuensis]|uniref:Non-specific serine/threonine protein kinase n=1 Tax=Nocardioides kongjuensis TaxID=349522 RepID=A0A852RRK0_9ACTN|nr:non-specific serine/threonine protein kinase [Nocardioides kongjuensis]
MVQPSSGARREADGPGAVPAELTRFIGRRREQSLAREALERSRLVTLIGLGGVGKTRLALELATRARDDFDEVRFARLADVLEPALLGYTLNTALGVREQSARWQLDTVVEFLGDRRVLLVLDNCEHLVEPIASLVDSLLRACPGLSVLTTSRQVLGLDGEAVVRVPPLSVASDGSASAESEAMSLFLDRASSAVPGLVVTPDEQEQIRELCRLLDGIPLAIELAAVRLRLLPLGELVTRTADRFHLLTQGSRTAPARHQSLRASIDGTYELCSPRERQLWSRLSVFSGGFSLEAAETVAGDATRDSILELVSGLVDKSIITRVMQAGEPRYAMLETIRQYGAERLDADELAELDRRHREWFAALAARADDGWSGPAQVEWLDRLRWDYPNLRVALQSCLADDPRRGMRLVASIENFWLASGFLSEARLWLDTLLAADASATTDRGRALRLSSWLAVLQNDHATVPQMLEEAGRIADEVGDGALATYVVQTWGLLAMFQGDLATSIDRLESAVAGFAELGHLTGQLHSLFELGIAYGFAGDIERAVHWQRRCQDLAGTVGESWWSSFSLWAYGIDKWRQGDIDGAESLERASLRAKRALDDRLGVGVCLEAMSWIAAANGESTRAGRLMGAAETVLRQVGMPIEASRSMLTYHQETQETLRLHDRRAEAAYAEGAAWDMDTAIGFALGEVSGNTEPYDVPLTRREMEVASLVAAGLTNRSIAAQLFISVRTVEKHVDHILGKLDLANRVQLAALIGRAADGP